MKKLTAPIMIAALAISGCATIKPLARTALEAARHACAVYASQTSVSFEDVCKTEQQLQPFIDAILAAQQAAAAQQAGAKGPSGACACPECPKDPDADPKPEAAPTPSVAPVSPAPTPEGKK